MKFVNALICLIISVPAQALTQTDLVVLKSVEHKREVLMLGNEDGNIHAFRCAMDVSPENKLIGEEQNCRSLGVMSRAQIESMNDFKGNCSELTKERVFLLAFLGIGTGVAGAMGALGPLLAAKAPRIVVMRMAVITGLASAVLGLGLTTYAYSSSCTNVVAQLSSRMSQALYERIPEGQARIDVVDLTVWPMIESIIRQNSVRPN